jgi:hypothetical protein
VAEIAAAEGTYKSYVSRILRLALLVSAAAFRRSTYVLRDRFALDIQRAGSAQDEPAALENRRAGTLTSSTGRRVGR